MKIAILITLLIALTLAQHPQEEQITYIRPDEVASQSTGQLVSLFASRQGEIIKKVFTHYVEEQVKRWRRSNISEGVIREKVVDLVVGRKEDLYQELRKFVEEALFAKLDMHLLVDSLQKEIRLNPENYYLTFEVYDLLID